MLLMQFSVRAIARLSLIILVLGSGMLRAKLAADSAWKKHIVHEGIFTFTAVAGDFSGDGRMDVISNSGGQTRLFVAPDWREIVIDDRPGHSFIHSEVMDVDGDGDLDYVGVRYSPGLIVWLERPERPLIEPWPLHIVDDQVNGIHGVIKGDVDKDGRLDLLATSAQSKGPFPYSLAWFRAPKYPTAAARWERYIFADRDAPGLSHYLGFGDINGDGRPDAASAAKGGAPTKDGEWFAWWEAPKDPRSTWKKHLISDQHPGATNIHPADVNGDGKVDLVASRGHGKGVIWFEAPSWREHTINPSLASPHCLAVIDMDGDGDVDVATCAFESKVTAWFENDSTGKFKTHILDRDQAAYDIRTIDMDGDGDIDILLGGQESNNVVWYESPLKPQK